jgi:hypothetical protein
MPKASNTVTISKAVLLENTQAGPTVFHDENSKTEVTWEGRGDSMGRDIQPVPLHYLENINFLRILNKGILVLVDAPSEVVELVEAQLDNPILNRQRNAWLGQRDKQAGLAVDNIEHTTRNDYLVQGCIGPDASGRGTCNIEVPVRESENVAPLCNAHKELSRFAVQFPTEQVVDGKETYVWRLSSVDAR